MPSIDIRPPNINAKTESGKLEQIRSYLYQVSDQLNWALSAISSNTNAAIQNIAQNGSKEKTPEEVQSNFNSIKALIIKSADIVESYSEVIEKKLEGKYVASSDFGDYKEETSATLTANSKDIILAFEDIQEINSILETIKQENIETSAYIKTGILYYDENKGTAVYGLEIGQTDTIDGEEVFNKFARFSADRLSFYDSNDSEVAYVSDYMLFITNARIRSTLYHGGYKIDSSDGLAYYWEGRRDDLWQ